MLRSIRCPRCKCGSSLLDGFHPAASAETARDLESAVCALFKPTRFQYSMMRRACTGLIQVSAQLQHHQPVAVPAIFFWCALNRMHVDTLQCFGSLVCSKYGVKLSTVFCSGCHQFVLPLLLFSALAHCPTPIGCCVGSLSARQAWQLLSIARLLWVATSCRLGRTCCGC